MSIPMSGWDMLLVTEKDCSFPLNEQGKSDSELARGGKMLKDAIKAENRDDDSFGQFTLADCFESKSRWIRQTVLTEEGYLIVRDTFEPDSKLDGFQIGPCWMLRVEGGVKDVLNEKTKAMETSKLTYINNILIRPSRY